MHLELLAKGDFEHSSVNYLINVDVFGALQVAATLPSDLNELLHASEDDSAPIHTSTNLTL
jgi:hypothetical protein